MRPLCDVQARPDRYGRGMRRTIAFLPLLLAQCLAESDGAHAPISGQPIEIAATPVALVANHPEWTRAGALRFVAGWRLTSPASAFGGLSSLDVEGSEVTALSDAGLIVRFHLGRFGHASRARIIPVSRGCGGGILAAGRDTESLAHDPAGGGWWIGFEGRNVICRLSEDLGGAKGVTAPRAMADWPDVKGAETILRLRDGRFIVFAEGAPDGGALLPVLLFAGDPAVPGAAVTQMRYRPPDAYSPTDAAQLPDGRILVLNRRFSIFSLFTARLVLLDPVPLRADAVLSGRVVARFAPPVIADNFEGLSVSVEDGKPIVWIVSDENYLSWQRTLLLKFALN
ncbi:MAG: esterase-like activity of phytase family protein [Sphingomonadaceae bacterium]|nr:esterase-like activity of phytase family protein [Sphingomonadaceae bacterium]